METIFQKNLDSFQCHDHLIIANVLSGQTKLFESLISKYNLKLSRLVRGYTKNQDEINDILQETYLKAFLNLHQFRFQASFFTWVCRIAINESLRFLKRKEQFVSYNALSGTEFAKISNKHSNGSVNPIELLIQEENQTLLGKAIATLHLKYRTPYQLKQEGLSVMEIGKVMGISSNNVKVRLYRARKKIRTKISDMT